MYDKIALVIGASIESIYGIQLAQKNHFHVIAFDGNAEAPGLHYSDESYVLDIRVASNIIQKLGNRRPNLIIPVPIGRWLVTSGVVNDFYGLKGISEKACNLCTDKYKFHVELNKKSLRKANCYLVSSGEVESPQVNNYPIIIKPRYGSGSRGVIAIDNEEMYKNYMKDNIPFVEDMIVESLILGKEYGVDGVIIDGVMQIVLLREKINTPFPSRQCIGYYSIVPSSENKDLYKKLNQDLQNITSTLAMNNCLFHADLVIDGEDIFIIEISPRPSGHYLHNKFTVEATGINMLGEYMKFCVNKQNYNFKPTYTKQMLIHYFSFENCTIKNIPDQKYIIEKYPLLEYQCRVKKMHYGTISEGHGLMERGYFIFKEDSIENLDSMKDQLLSEFEVVKDGE